MGARERLSQLPLLNLMLSQDVIIMVMAMDTATMDTMAKGRLMLSPGIIIMATDILMVGTDTMGTMERGRLMLSLDTITMVMAMDMGDMDTMVTMARERLSQDIIIMVTVMADMAIMVMDTTVNKQHLFISFQNSVTFIGTCWNLVNRNTHLEKKYKKIVI